MNLTVNKFSLNNNVKSKKSNSFKSTFATVHWVAEKGGEYYPMQEGKIVKHLQRNLITVLNKNKQAKNNSSSLYKRFVEYLKSFDKDFKNNNIVRSFYDFSVNQNQPSIKSYMITGGNVEEFNSKFASDLECEKPEFIDLKARKKYLLGGFDYVTSSDNLLKDENGIAHSLHTKFEIVRNEKGDIIDYKFKDAKFFPTIGSENPLVKYNSTKH